MIKDYCDVCKKITGEYSLIDVHPHSFCFACELKAYNKAESRRKIR